MLHCPKLKWVSCVKWVPIVYTVYIVQWKWVPIVYTVVHSVHSVYHLNHPI